MPLVCLSSHGFVVNQIEMEEPAVALVDALVDGLTDDCSQVGFNADSLHAYDSMSLPALGEPY
jgi:hypothetical protein